MKADTSNPNILVLLCDQLQRNVLDIYGGPVLTVAWRSLAETGIAFDRFYCATPLCVPTRPSMMTGRWPHSHGSICFGKKEYSQLNEGEELLIDRLHDSGYRVGFSGIWHVNRAEQEDRSNEYAYFEQISFPYGPHEEMRAEQDVAGPPSRATVRTPCVDGVKEWGFSVPVPVEWTDAIEEHPDMVIARRIADFIRSTPPGTPFASWCSVGAPHPPLLVPQPYLDMFDPKDMEPPPGFGKDMAGLPAAVAEGAAGWQSVRDWDWPTWSVAIAGYYGYAAFADACMKVVLDALDESGRRDNTIVVGTIDHGEMLGAHNLYQKGVLYDRACRLPCVMCVPGLEPGRRAQLASHVDFAPTLLDLAGLDPLQNAQGVSLAPILQDEQAPGPDYEFMEFNGYIDCGLHTRGIVSERYKYIYHHQDKDMLFDLVEDPDELTDLSGSPAHAGIMDTLRSELVLWMQRTGDFIEMA